MAASARNSGKARVGVLAAVLVAGLFTITARLYWVQVLHSDRFVRLAADQRVRRIDLAPQRGSITDRNGSELAISTDARTIYANPRFVTDPAGSAAALAPLLGIPAGDLHPKLDRRSGFVYLARKADPEVAKKVAALKIP
ncbi:MAG: penicillin-binding protein, partial [Actinomycetota bacterium]